MRRALALLAVFAACLLVAAPAFAPAAPAPEEEGEVFFSLRSEGFAIAAFGSDNDGKVSLLLQIVRGHQVGEYFTPATMTKESVTAKFGSLGEVNFHFAPKHPGSLKCGSVMEFTGEFTFTGENEYVHIDADHAEGSFGGGLPPKECGVALAARRAVPYTPSYSGHGATLTAKTPSRRFGPLLGRGIDVYDLGLPHHDKVEVFAYRSEEREGMIAARGVRMAMAPAAFRWNVKGGTASLRPPAPFTGSAKFTRGAHGPGLWEGTLAMPIFGGETVELTGPTFHAQLHKGTPVDE